MGDSNKTATMPIESTDPPISNLNVEILWKIFWENTDMLENGQEPHFEIEEKEQSKQGDKPLNILRRTAQVCHFWREIILGPGSSQLWGRVIDLDILQWKGRVDWRKEVIARAGNGPLHIVGTIRADFEDCRIFLGDLLDQHWSSIKVLVVAISGRFKSTGANLAEFWRPLQRPSPLLHTFKLIFGAENSRAFRFFNGTLFANDAPALHVFGLRQAPKPQFYLAEPWLKNLRIVEFLIDEPCFHGPTFMTALSNMPYLESMAIGNILFEPPSNRRSQKTSLRFLTNLLIMAPFKSTSFLIDNIIPSSTCSVSLSVSVPQQRSGLSADTDTQTMCDALSRYTNGCLVEAHQRAESSYLYVLPHMFIFIAARNYGRDPKFLFRFCFQEMLPSALVSRLLASLLPAPGNDRFAHLKTFSFSYARVMLNDEQLDMLARFCASLVSVTELFITDGLETILDVQTRSPGIFPRLEKLTLQDMDAPGTIKDAVQFLSGRIDGGRNLKTLELPERPNQVLLDDLNCLDVIPGLKVIWGHNEYMCGSGNPREVERE